MGKNEIKFSDFFLTKQDEAQLGDSARQVLGEDPVKSRLRKVSILFIFSIPESLTENFTV
jgi:hypothetical protein